MPGSIRNFRDRTYSQSKRVSRPVVVMKSTRACLAVLDFGTGGGKCVIFDHAGQRLSSIRHPWDFISVRSSHEELTPGFAFDPESMWNTLARCTREAIDQANLAPEEIVAVTSTSLRLGTVFLDRRKQEVYCAPNLDGRGFAGALELLDAVTRETIVSTTGHWPPFLSSAARLITYQKEPTAEPVAHVLSLSDWLGYRLTGEITSELSNAGESFLLDIAERRWSQELLEAAGISPSVLPPISANGARIGSIHTAAAAATSLKSGTPVFLGGADTQCALLGSGVVDPFEAGVVLGTTAPVMAISDTPCVDLTGKVWAGCHVLPERWTLESNAGETGSAWDWILDLLGIHGADRYEVAENLMAEVTADDELDSAVVSFGHPQVFDLDQYNPHRMVGFGFRQSAFRGPVGPGRGQVLRSFLRNIAFAIRGNLEQLEEKLPGPPNRCTLSGGMSRSRSLQVEIARSLHLPLHLSAEPEATALGAAILASVGVGLHGDRKAAVHEMVQVTVIPPDPELRDAYDRQYAAWQEVFAATKQVSFLP